MRYSVDATAVTALVTDVASCLGDATTAYVTGDEEMASTTSSASSAAPPLRGRGFGPAVF